MIWLLRVKYFAVLHDRAASLFWKRRTNPCLLHGGCPRSKCYNGPCAFIFIAEDRCSRYSQDVMRDLGTYTLLSGIIGSRIFFIMTNCSHYRLHPADMVKIWEGGLIFYGRVLFALLTAVWYARRRGLPLWQTADIWAPSIAIGHAIGRLGCFCAGCCYGRPAAEGEYR